MVVTHFRVMFMVKFYPRLRVNYRIWVKIRDSSIVMVRVIVGLQLGLGLGMVIAEA